MKEGRKEDEVRAARKDGRTEGRKRRKEKKEGRKVKTLVPRFP